MSPPYNSGAVRSLVIVLAAAAGLFAYFVLRGAKLEPVLDPYTAEYTLPKAVQRRLWKIEALALRLSTATASELATALRTRDAAPWLRTFSGGFSATCFTGDGRSETHGPVRRTQWSAPGPASTVDGPGLVEHLFGLRDQFEGAPDVAVHYELLSPVAYAELDGAFNATCTIDFRGELKTGGKAKIDLRCALVCEHIPSPGDAREPWLASFRSIVREERRTSDFLMEDVTESSGIDTLALMDSWAMDGVAAAFVGGVASHMLDFDADGNLDLLVCDRNLHLYRGRGDGTFDEVAAEVGLPVDSEWFFPDGTIADFDNDGDEDLLLDGVSESVKGRNFAFENRSGHFHLRSDFAQLDVSVAAGSIADYDADGLVDIYLPVAGVRAPEGAVARWIGDRTSAEGVLLKNLGGWRFADVTVEAGALAEHRDIFAAAWTDLEPDGDADLVLAHHLGDNVVLENLGNGRFSKRPIDEGFGGFSMGLTVGDLDEDGDPDIYLANMGSASGNRIMNNLREEDYPPGVYALVRGWITGNVVLRNRGPGQAFRQDFEHNAGWSYGPALVDLDGDGRLDIYSPAGFQSVDRDKPDG